MGPLAPNGQTKAVAKAKVGPTAAFVTDASQLEPTEETPQPPPAEVLFEKAQALGRKGTQGKGGGKSQRNQNGPKTAGAKATKPPT